MFSLVRDGKRHGPFTAAQLRKLAVAGKLNDFDLVMKAGDDKTRLVAEIPELQRLLEANATTIKSNSQPTPTSAPAKTRPDSYLPSPRMIPVTDLVRQVWNKGKLAAEIGSVAGFIGDFLQPLGPINGVLFLLALVANIIFGVSWLRLDPPKRAGFDRWYPQQLCISTGFLVAAFGGWCLLQQLNAESDRGVLGGNLTLVAQAQDSLLRIQQDVATIKQDVGDIKTETARLQRATNTIADTSREIKEDTAAVRAETTGIRADTAAIRESVEAIGKQRGLVAAPHTAADHYHNAMVHIRDGNHAAAEESFKQFFGLDDGTCFDAYRQYAGLLLGNYAPPRPKRLLESLAQTYPKNMSAQLLVISETARDDGEARRRLTEFVKEHGQFLPAFSCLKDLTPAGLLIDDLARDELRAAFRAAGGTEALKAFVLNPVEGEGQKMLENALAFENEPPVDPLRRLVHGLQADPDITLLWLGVDDVRPGREIVISFAGGQDVQLPLDSPDNPASMPGARGIPTGVTPGTCVAVELPRHPAAKKAKKPAFVPRSSNDVRIFPHAGELEGVAFDPSLEVTVSYVDAEGRRYRFPKPVKLLSQDEGSGEAFAVEIARRDSFDPTPVLQITPPTPMSRIEVSGRAEGPFVPAPEHMNVPTMNEIPCGAVPFLVATRGSTKVWVRGTTDQGDGVAAVAMDVDVPPAVRWKTFEPSRQRPAAAEGSTAVELQFDPPDTYSDFYIDRIVFSPDGERLAAMMERAGLVVWQIKSRRQTHLVKAETGKTLTFSGDGSRLTNGLVTVDLTTEAVSPGFDSSYDTFGAAVSASLEAAATVDRYQNLTIYDFRSVAESAEVKLGQQHGFPNVVALSPDAALIAVGGVHVDVVWLIDRAAGKVRKKLEAPGTGITSLAFSPDGKELLAVGPASCVRIWNVFTEEDTAGRLTLDDNSPEAMWTMKGIPLVADIGPAGLTVTDARTGKSVAQVDGPVKKFAISPTGTAIAIAKKTSVVIRPIE